MRRQQKVVAGILEEVLAWVYISKISCRRVLLGEEKGKGRRMEEAVRGELEAVVPFRW